MYQSSTTMLHHHVSTVAQNGQTSAGSREGPLYFYVIWRPHSLQNAWSRIFTLLQSASSPPGATKSCGTGPLILFSYPHFQQHGYVPPIEIGKCFSLHQSARKQTSCSKTRAATTTKSNEHVGNWSSTASLPCWAARYERYHVGLFVGLHPFMLKQQSTAAFFLSQFQLYALLCFCTWLILTTECSSSKWQKIWV